MKWGKCSPTMTTQCHPISVSILWPDVQDLFTLNFKIKLKSKGKRLGIIFGQNNKNEV